MAKLLSQEEIDALLNAGKSGVTTQADPSLLAQEEEPIEINPYNFKRPRLFAQDQIRVLNHIHESFARDLSGYLSAQLRTIVNINLYTVDQVLYSEYVLSSAPPSALYVIGLQNIGQDIVIEMDPRLVIFIVEKLFGGPGIFVKRPREISPIEQRIMRRVMNSALKELEKAWEQIHPVTLKQEAFESNAEFVQIIPGVEPVMVVTFEVLIYEQRSLLNICYPYILLERLLTRSGMKRWLSNLTSQVNPRVKERFHKSLSTVNVEMKAELGRAHLPMREVLSLQEGDIIPLTRKISEPVEVYIENALKFKAYPGRSGKRHALRIVEIFEPDLLTDDDD